MIKKACRNFHCPGFAIGNGYCEAHQSLAPKPFSGSSGDPTVKAEYASSEWRNFRRGFLDRYQVCVCCGKPATVVDHYRMTAPEMLRLYGKFIYSEELYRPLCASCNTASRNKVYRRRKEVAVDPGLR